MRTDAKFLGHFGFYRKEVRPFSGRQIALLENFAEQAVLGMENARLLGELRERTRDLQESLEYQTAISDLLKVISRSTFDLQPVLDLVVQTAARLCDAPLAALAVKQGEHYRYVATVALTAEFDAAVRSKVLAPGRHSIVPRTVLERQVVQIPDVAADPEYELTETISLGKVRTILGVPLLRDGEPIGVISLGRQRVEPFTERQIELVRTFADQAVIAIENTRLLAQLRARTRELEEALEYQTGTSDVLRVISRSAGELQPVLDTLLETATRICRADSGFIFRLEEGLIRMVAWFGVPAEYWDFQVRHPIAADRGTLAGRTVLELRAVHIEDAASDPEYSRPEAVQLGRQRTMLGVPLIREDSLIGVITLARSRVERFTEKEIERVTTFADQAVIAIENTRLLTELRERTRDLQESLEYQTAASDGLKVISRSTFDLQPVLNTLVQTAARLCRANLASINIREGEVYRSVARVAHSPEADVFARDLVLTPNRETVTGRVALEGKEIHVADIAADPNYTLRGTLTVGKIRTALGVPLLRQGDPIGVIFLARQRVEPFTERQIEMVRSFADQAVIAMENTRLFTELRERTWALQESLEYQTATSDVLKVISRSTFDLQPVLDALVETAARLCRADIANIRIPEDGVYRVAATFAHSPEHNAFARSRVLVPDRRTAVGRAVLERQAVHIPDIAADPEFDLPGVVPLGKIRTALGVPLLREGEPVGVIFLGRQRMEPFGERQIELVRTFADQAVIAIENTRLLTELRARTDELTRREAELRVTFDNMGDGVAMFDAELRFAAWNHNFKEILDIPDELLSKRRSYEEYFRYLAERGEFGAIDIETEWHRIAQNVTRQWSVERTRPDGRVIEVRHNPVPGGGFVLIYSDVTERKRAEAEIRAARDAAETAFRELKAAQASLIHAEKMASLGQLTAGIAHEIKNPLNFVNNFASLSVELLDELKETAAPAIATLDENTRDEIEETIATLTRNLGKIEEHGRRADGIVKSMLAHSRGTSGEREAVDVNALTDDTLNLAYHGRRAQDQSFNITLERDLAPGIAPIELVPQDITRVLLNLLSNGFYAANKKSQDLGGKPVLKVTTRDLGGEVEIRVRDNGTGIPAEFRNKLFQPFFTTKPTGEGTGLGLSISYDIVTQEHGGTITVESEPGAFTEFTVRLPRIERPTALWCTDPPVVLGADPA